MEASDDNGEILQLDAETELRFGVYVQGREVILQISEGTAELFGSPLQLNEKYKFVYFSSVAVFTWSGCTLKIETSHRIKYKIKTSKEVPIMKDFHSYLESFRDKAETNSTKCPITLITGPTDVGKSTLCRYLLNCAARHGRRPIFVDLDVGQSSSSITGTFSVACVQEPCDINGRFDEKLSAVYFFGYKSPGHNMRLYKDMLKKLGKALNARLRQESDITRNSGVIIDTCGWVDGPGYNLILDIIKLLKVNIVTVIGDDSLHSKLINDLSSRTEVTCISELEGVSYRNKTVRCNNRDFCVYEYFYGSTKSLKPFMLKVQFSDLQIYKAKTNSKKDTDNWRTDDNNSDVISIPIEPSIVHQVLGLSYAEQVEDILLCSVYGFICLINVDMDSKTAEVLSPQPAPLPTKTLLMGDITLMPRDMSS